jgi:hypothetical protein
MGGKKVTVSLKAIGGERKVTYDIAKPSFALFTVKAGVTFIIEENVVIAGVQEAGGSLVNVDSGTFIMNGCTVKDNKNGGGVVVTGGTFTMNNGTISGNAASSGSNGGGVYVGNGSTFTMNNGTISGNTASSYYSSDGNGGGVYVNGGSFTMNDGAITGNTASGYGGGVVVTGGTFTMDNGVISGNTASSYGGGVYVSSYATFIKSGRGGIIYGINAPEGVNSSKSGNGHAVYVEGGKKRDNTARITMAMDSTKSGPENGWD